MQLCPSCFAQPVPVLLLKGKLSCEGWSGEGMAALHCSNLRSLLLCHSLSPCHHTKDQKGEIGSIPHYSGLQPLSVCLDFQGYTGHS